MSEADGVNENMEVEQARERSTCKIEIIPSVIIDNQAVEPYIVIGTKGDKVQIFVNSKKQYRVLHLKGEIQQALNVFLVDEVIKLLKGIAKNEEAAEKEIKKMEDEEYARKIRQSGSTGDNRSDAGQGRIETGDGFV